MTDQPITQVRRVLIVDDNPAIFDDFRKILCKTQSAAAAAIDDLEAAVFGDTPCAGAVHPSYDVAYARQGQEALTMVQQAIAESRPYALAFVDMRMPPGWDGVETIKHLWEADPDLQVVVCTAYSDRTPAQINHGLGISNQMLILRKPFDGADVRQLAATLTEKWQIHREHAELRRLVAERNADLQRASLHDKLTGLPNRALFHDRLNQAILRARRNRDSGFAVLFIDFDRFKVVNDSLGHVAGDSLLLAVSHRLTATLREVDTVSGISLARDADSVTARLGSDEFAVLLDGIHSDADALRVAQRIITALARPYTIGSHEVHSSASIGITTSSLKYDSCDDVVRDADTAMHRAKAQGGSNCVVFDPSMHRQAMSRLTLENDLRIAIEQKQISLVYQPIVSLADGRVLGCEALCRWNHPTRGPVSPAEFIPVAEETGLIIPLGHWVLKTACEQLGQWQRSHPALAGLTISVNLSRKQLAVPDLTRRIAEVLQHSGVRPECLKLEITESTVMDDARRATAVLQEIQRMRVQLHMDDFGSGHSSLSCLQQFPLDGLKIDKDFVQGLNTRPDHEAILRTVVTLAHSLGVPLVAEGIETPEQRAALTAMGCDQAQGYLFAKPMPAPDLEQFLITRSKAIAA